VKKCVRDGVGCGIDVSDDGSSDIAGFSVNTSTGVLTPIAGSPFPSLGALPEGLVTDTLGKFLYTADDGGTVSGYSINATTGALTALPGFPVSTPAGNSSLAMTPSGKFLYVAPFNSSTGINAFSVNATTGALTPVPGSPFGAGVNSENIGGFAIDPTGRFLYKANIIDAGPGDNISAFSIASNGALTQIAGSPFSTPREPASVTIDPAGKFVYVADLGSNHLQSFAINQATGSLTPLENVDTGTDPFAMAFVTGANPVVYTPTFAYAVNLTDKTVSQYTINPTTGALTSIGSALGDINGPQAMAAIPGGKFIFAGDTNSKLSGYKVNATTGALNKIVGSPFLLSGLNNPVALTSFISAAGFGTLLCTANAGDNTLSAYIIDPTSGTPSVLFTGIAGGVGPHAMAATPLGNYAFVVNSGDNSLWSYAACSSPVPDAITGLPGFPTGVSPMGVTVDPGGQYVYVANNGDNTVSAYKIADGTDISAFAGAPVPITGSPYPAGSGPVAALVEPLGRYLYVANSGGTISAYSIAPTTGALTAITGTFNTGSSPDSLSTSNDGKFLYAANKSAGSVSSSPSMPMGL
jgi:6-phosphogluconolactonase